MSDNLTPQERLAEAEAKYETMSLSLQVVRKTMTPVQQRAIVAEMIDGSGYTTPEALLEAMRNTIDDMKRRLGGTDER